MTTTSPSGRSSPETEEAIEEQIGLLTAKLTKLRIASSSGSAVGGSSAPVSFDNTVLAARPILPEITALVAVPEAHEGEHKEHTTAGSRKASSQPMFDGDDYRGFLVTYRRWSMVSGVDRADEEHKLA